MAISTTTSDSKDSSGEKSVLSYYNLAKTQYWSYMNGSNATPATKPALATKRHPEFYFDNTLRVIQVSEASLIWASFG